MSASLNSLPEELILATIELGDIGPLEGLYLRWSCQRLHRIASTSSFWLVIAKNLRRERPLPLPAFTSLSSLSVPELMALCVRHHRTSANLSSKQPEPRRHRFSITAEHETVIANVTLLPGGRYCLLFRSKGLVCLYDLLDEDPAPPSTLSSDSRVPAAKPCGRLLNTYNTGLIPEVVDFQVSEEYGKRVVVTVAQTPSDNSEPKIGGLVVFSYTFTDEGVTLQEHVRSECQFEQRLAVYLGGSMVAVRYMHVGHWTLLVHDWLEQTGPKSICIKTTIACHPTDDLDVFVLPSGDILLCGISAAAMTVHGFFDIKSELTTHASPSTPVSRAPNATRVIPYLPDFQFTKNIGWLTWHPWNAHGSRRPKGTVVASSSNLARTASRTHSVQWLDVERIMQETKESVHEMAPPMRRAYYQHTSPSEHGWTELEVISTYGHHMLWVDIMLDPTTQGWKHELKLLEILGRAEGDDELELVQRPPSSLRTLDIPVPIRSVLHYDFCDEWGILAVVITESPGVHAVHLFDY